jgi:hypothetical protein
MTYLRCVVVATLAILAAAASMNYFADPGRIYRSDRAVAKQYVDSLLRSKYGLWWPPDSIEERAIKRELAEHSSDVECVVVGSSHAMEIGSARRTPSLTDTCSSILNLAVSGAGIEDDFTLVYLALTHGHPRKIVLGVDPWTFAFGTDARWSYYATDYRRARQAISGQAGAAENDEGTAFKKFRNLFSLEYTIRSAGKAARELTEPPVKLSESLAPQTDEAIGGKFPVFFRDGSAQNSASYLAEANRTPIPIGGIPYKTDGLLNEPAAIDAYKSLLLWIRSKGAEPILLLTPYHQNVWAAKDSANSRALRETEPIVRSLAAELRISVIGSYDPNTAGCSRNEFFDFMHPKPDCLKRLQKVGVSQHLDGNPRRASAEDRNEND